MKANKWLDNDLMCDVSQFQRNYFPFVSWDLKQEDLDNLPEL